MPMNRQSHLFLKQYVLAICTFISTISQSILIRDDKEDKKLSGDNEKFSQRCGIFNSIYCSIIIISISFLMQKERNKGVLWPSFFVSLLFFISGQINFYFIPLLSPTYTTICTQPRLIMIYVLSLLFMKNKFRISNIIGISLIILSLVLISLEKGGISKNHFLRNCFFVSLGSVFSGAAFFSFDYFIKAKVVCPYHYITISQMITLVLSALFLLFRKYLLQDVDFSVIKDGRFYLLATSYTMFSLCVFSQSFLFDMIPRILFGILVRTTADISTEFYYNKGLSLAVMTKYSICMLGVLIYQYNKILSYFKKQFSHPSMDTHP